MPLHRRLFARWVRRAAVLLVLVLVSPAAGWDDFLVREEGISIHVRKRERALELRDDGRVIRRFPIRLGARPDAPKRVSGDYRTPVGTYYIREKRSQSRFRRFLGLSYPSIDDADRGLDHGLIDQEQWADIFFANLDGRMPPADTRLGGLIGIHGYGGRPELPSDWTKGCIAVSDAAIDEIFSYVEVGTPVVIFD